jgi:hypothetical protein
MLLNCMYDMDRKIASFGNPPLDLWTWPLVIVKFFCNLIIKYMYFLLFFFGVYWLLSSFFLLLSFLKEDMVILLSSYEPSH